MARNVASSPRSTARHADYEGPRRARYTFALATDAGRPSPPIIPSYPSREPSSAIVVHLRTALAEYRMLCGQPVDARECFAASEARTHVVRPLRGSRLIR